MTSDSNNIFGFFDEFEASEGDSQQLPIELIQEPFEISSTIDSQSPKVQQEVIRRIKIIAFVEKRLKGGWTEKNLTPLLSLAESELQLTPPSWRTIATWKKSYFEAGREPWALIPKHTYKGNSQREMDSQALINEAIKNVYLTRERLSVADAYRYYKSRVIQINRGIVEGKIKPISERSFYNRIHDLPPYEVAIARFGKRYADREFRSVGQQVAATKPMEYVEIDHTPVPVILIDDELDIPLGRPYLTMLYDRFSKCIVGCSINFREPSFDSVRKALLNSLLDKSWVKQRYPCIDNEWPCTVRLTV